MHRRSSTTFITLLYGAALLAACAAESGNGPVAPAVGELTVQSGNATTGLRATLRVDGRDFAVETQHADGRRVALLRDDQGALVARWSSDQAGGGAVSLTINGHVFAPDELTRDPAAEPATPEPGGTASEAGAPPTTDAEVQAAIEANLNTNLAVLRAEATAPTGRALLVLATEAGALGDDPNYVGLRAELLALRAPGQAIRTYAGDGVVPPGVSIEQASARGCDFYVREPAIEGDPFCAEGFCREAITARAHARCDRPRPQWSLRAYVSKPGWSSFFGRRPVDSVLREANVRYDAAGSWQCSKAGTDTYESIAFIMDADSYLVIADTVKRATLTCRAAWQP